MIALKINKANSNPILQDGGKRTNEYSPSGQNLLLTTRLPLLSKEGDFGKPFSPRSKGWGYYYNQ